MNYTKEQDGKYTVNVWSDGTKEWYLNGELHREDGPAYEHPDGTKEWWVNDKIVYNDSQDNLSDYPDLPEPFKRSIIKYKLKHM